MSAQTTENIAARMQQYRCPRYAELPIFPLYRDQLLEALNYYILPLCSDQSQPPVTAAMINNYVKLKLVDAPVKKRYSRDQIAQLLCILLLKQVFSISEIRSLLEIQTRTYPFPQAYDYFCMEFESALQAAFSTRNFSGFGQAEHFTPQSELVRSAALCLAQKIFTQQYLAIDSVEPIAPIDLTAVHN